MGPVSIGDRLSTGQFVSILGPRHPIFDRSGDVPRTIIGNDVWISTGAIILSGAEIGDGAVISAGSVVSGRIPSNTLYLEQRRGHFFPIPAHEPLSDRDA
jgi:maltose O-acetyltransferase